MSDNLLSFRIGTGLKNIIGRDLITDDYIAVFELVKNSFDAHAKKVTITFKKEKIIITDDGKGMDIDDINKKWLFVAYSAKKEGVEDDELKEKGFDSYRDKIQAKKYYAGAKGIGRFSCDRLGSKLILTTKKASDKPKIEQIEVNWNDFDKDHGKGFIEIKVRHRTLQPQRKELKKLGYGTILEISNLNSKWDRTKKQGLKHSLEKLINPFDETQNEKFNIIIEDESELEDDKAEKLKRNRVNGEVKNFILETIGVKTTQIITQIDDEGKYITTELWDRGVLIYKIRRKNNTTPSLSNLKFQIFFLNKAAKHNFTRLMGIEPIYFGSIFLYRNGFRVAPYGDFGFDYFGLDTRKAQKHFQHLGSRDLIGRIEIMGNNPNFKEISSRDGGLVRNEYYHAMVKCFIQQGLVKLENYVSKVQWTNKEDKEREDLSALENINAKSALLKLVSDEIDDDQSELLGIDQANLNIRSEELLRDATSKDIAALKIIAEKLGDKIFTKGTEKTEKEHFKILELKKEVAENEKTRLLLEAENKKLEAQLALEKDKNTYLKTSSHSLSEDAKSLVHNIKFTTGVINSNVDTLYDKVKSGKVNNEEILRRLGTIKFNSDKALKISKLITRSNFKAQQNEQVVDVVKYIEQYITIYSDIYEKSELDFEIRANSATLIKKISVLDISIILDDLISNAEKAGAKKVLIEMSNPSKTSLNIVFSDSGKGVPKHFLDSPEEMFELGVTTTDGSGIGLRSVRNALKAMTGTISFIGNNLSLKGASFEIIIK
jgi:signal transduction histidine kinase